MLEPELTRAAKKYYTIPDGEYKGSWCDKWVWLYNESGDAFVRIDVKHNTKRAVNICAVVNFPTIKIYGKDIPKDRRLH